MLARARLKLKNAESSISFIQEQHTRTLEGLHQEIQQLQQKNARLTFELAVQGSSTAKSAAVDPCKHAEELQAYRSEVDSLCTALTTCKEEIKFLKHRLLAAETNFSEEVSERDAKIGRLSAEVDRRARIIAHLTRQLQQMRMEFLRVSDAKALVQSMAATVVSTPDHSGSRRTTAAEPPATEVGRIRRRARRATASALPHDPDTREEKPAPRRSLPTPVSHPHTSATPTASPRPPSTSPPPARLRHRASRLSRRNTTADKTQRSSTNLDPVQLQRPPPDLTDILRNDSTLSLTRSVAPILPPIPTNPSLLASSRQQLGGGGEREEGEGGGRRLLMKEEVPHSKNQAWQELHQSGSD